MVDPVDMMQNGSHEYTIKQGSEGTINTQICEMVSRRIINQRVNCDSMFEMVARRVVLLMQAFFPMGI